MPLYATNGRVQDLPSNTQFKFWDNQLDWGRAYKIAQIEQLLIWGNTQGIGISEFYVNLLLDSILNDPCKTFTSRPAYQEVDWKQWGAFCKWFFARDMLDIEGLVRNIKGGNCGYWLGQFLASNYKANGDWCYVDSSKVDNIKYWGPQFQFDTMNCTSTSKLPDHWPTPQEIAQAEVIANWWNDTFGSNEVQRLSEPTNTQQLANQTSKQSPPVVVKDKNIDTEVQVVEKKKDIPWTGILIGGGVVLFLTIAIGYSMKKEEDFKL